MSSSGDDDDEGSFILYRDREEWKDVTPIPSDEEGADPVVSIDYSEQFADVFDYIRGVIKSGERSQRVLDLTEDAIKLNAANYTVWQLRRDVIEALKVSMGGGVQADADDDPALQKEFNFCHQMIMSNQKNYQVWHHRKAMVMAVTGYDEQTKKMPSASPSQGQAIRKIFEEELKLTTELLKHDPKNYHAWQYRQWTLSTFGDFSNELDYINGLLAQDVRNNSAWNQRYFVVVNLKNFSPVTLMREMSETWAFIKQAPSNESPWSYLRGIINLAGDASLRLHLLQEVASRCRELLSKDVRTVPHLALLIETHSNLLKHGAFSNGELKQFYDEAIMYLDQLSTTIDPIRRGYWESVKRKFVGQHSQTISNLRPPL